MERFDWLLSNYRWWRKWRGGHWEYWWIDAPVASSMWLLNTHGTRPGLGRGAPICEEW